MLYLAVKSINLLMWRVPKSLSFMTLTFLKSTGHLFCKILLSRVFDVSLWVNSGYPILTRIILTIIFCCQSQSNNVYISVLVKCKVLFFFGYMHIFIMKQFTTTNKKIRKIHETSVLCSSVGHHSKKIQ